MRLVVLFHHVLAFSAALGAIVGHDATPVDSLVRRLCSQRFSCPRPNQTPRRPMAALRTRTASPAQPSITRWRTVARSPSTLSRSAYLPRVNAALRDLASGAPRHQNLIAYFRSDAKSDADLRPRVRAFRVTAPGAVERAPQTRRLGRSSVRSGRASETSRSACRQIRESPASEHCSTHPWSTNHSSSTPASL